MITKRDVGKAAELMVAGYLRSKGYIIFKMNYHSRFGEIDIIAEDRKHIVFVEVKLRHEHSLVSPAAAVDIHKQRRITLTAKDFLAKANVSELQPRFDVAEVFMEDEFNNEKLRINYIKNAF